MLITTNPQQTLWETILPPGYQDLPASWPQWTRCWTTGVLRPLPGALPAAGSPVDPDRDPPADDVPQAPLRAGLRDPVPRGQGLAVVVAVLPDPARLPGAAPLDPGEDHLQIGCVDLSSPSQDTWAGLQGPATHADRACCAAGRALDVGGGGFCAGGLVARWPRLLSNGQSLPVRD